MHETYYLLNRSSNCDLEKVKEQDLTRKELALAQASHIR